MIPNEAAAHPVPSGILIVDKPSGFTSFDVIAKLRGMLQIRKLGHGGTLDPMATGVLPVFIGAATKAADLLPNSSKRYTAVVQLGLCTDTGDITGSVLEHCVPCTEVSLLSVLPQFTGTQEQVPPMYSAVKVQGRRLYTLAREGKTVERKKRVVTVHRLRLLDFDKEKNLCTLDVLCEKGTYIRTLAEDITRAAGSCGTLCALRRTESAGFTETIAHTLDDIRQACLQRNVHSLFLPVDDAFSSYQHVVLRQKESRSFLNGASFKPEGSVCKAQDGDVVRIYNEESAFLGLAQLKGSLFVKLMHYYTESIM